MNKILDILNQQQENIIMANEDRIVVSAGPGSGKTYTLVKRIVNQVSEDPSIGIIATSFTKEASKQLKNKLQSQISTSNLYIGTLDSLVLSEIINPFKNEYLKICNKKTTNGKITFKMPERGSNVEKMTRDGINNYNLGQIRKEFDLWIQQFSDGIYEISSLTYLVAIDLLKKYSIAKKYIESKYKYIYIDEAQDLNEYQHKFITYLYEKCNMKIMMIGDKNQSIYKFRGSRPELFCDLTKNKGFKEYKISVSLRCHPSILLFSNLIIQEFEPVSLDSVNIDFDFEPIESNLKQEKNNFLVLFENNKDALNCFKYCHERSIKVIYSKRLDFTNKKFTDNYLDLIEEILRFRLNISNKNAQLVYSVEDFKDFLRNDYFIKPYDEKIIEDIAGTVGEYICRLFNLLNIEIDDKTLKELDIQMSNPVIFNHYKSFKKVNRIMTIHSSKGLEAETVYVRLSSNPFNIDDEYRRKLFVAFSRAKNKLNISYKKGNIKDSKIDKLLRDNKEKLNKCIDY